MGTGAKVVVYDITSHKLNMTSVKLDQVFTPFRVVTQQVLSVALEVSHCQKDPRRMD